ncbi:MAG: hypothetical protein ACO1NZ_09080 [Adhaeribacter sp.]
MQVKKAIIRSAKKVALLIIAEKLNTAQRIRICPVNQVGYLVTELPPESPALASYKSGDMKVL